MVNWHTKFGQRIYGFAGLRGVVVWVLTPLMLLVGGGGAAWAQMFMPFGTAVSPSGDFNYSVPISLPPVASGLQPSLSLSYSSSAGDGLLGIGWQLFGESRITRCPQTILQDGARKAISNTASDRFCLDGQRLIAIGSGAYGADGTEYRTEQDGYTKIVSYGNKSGGPDYFAVWGRGGLKSEYGNTVDSKLTNNSGAVAVVWAINNSVDPMGNVLNYEYINSQADGQIYLSKIGYGGSLSSSVFVSPYMVQLTYVDRVKPITQYSVGSVYTIAKLLSKVAVSKNGQDIPVWRYELSYEGALSAATGRPRLSSVRQCMKGGNICYPEVLFEWTGQAVAGRDGVVKKFPSGLDIFNGYSNLTIDFNGDGLMDILSIKGDAYWALIAKPSEGFVVSSKKLPAGINLDDGVATKTLLGDFNGDGLTDIFIARAGSYWILLSDGRGGFSTKGAQPIPGGVSYASAGQVTNLDYSHYQWLVMDVDGDGLQDVVVVGPLSDLVASYAASSPLVFRVFRVKSDQTMSVAYSDVGASINSLLQTPNWVPSDTRYVSSMGVADFDGDGRPDIFASVAIGDRLKRQDGVFVFKIDDLGGVSSSSMSFSTSRYNLARAIPRFSSYYSQFDLPPFSRASIIDFNNDGIPDLIGEQEPGKNVPLLLNKGGGGFVEFAAPIQPSTNDVFSWAYMPNVLFPDSVGPMNMLFFAADVSGDDVVDMSAIEAGPKISQYMHKGGGVFSGAVVSSVVSPDYSVPVVGDVISGDFDGDGLIDFFVKRGAPGEYYEFISGRERPDLLKQVRVGEVIRTVNYKPVIQAFGSEYLPTTDAVSYPLIKTVNSRSLVVKTQTSVAGVAKQTNEYKYGGLLRSIGQDGRGELGFAWVQTRNVEAGLYSRTYFRQDFPLIGSVDVSGRGTSEANWNNLSLTAYKYTLKAFAANDGNYVSPVTCVDDGSTGRMVKSCIDSAVKPGNRYVTHAHEVLGKDWDWSEQSNVFIALPQTRTTTTSDGWGNAVQVKVETLKADGSASGYSRITDSIFADPDMTNWRLGRVIKSTVTDSSP